MSFVGVVITSFLGIDPGRSSSPARRVLLPAGTEEETALQTEILPDAAALADRCASAIATAISQAVGERGRCVVAFSGGRSPRQMLERLATLDVDWARVDVVQVDERVAPPGNADRNSELLRSALLERVETGPRGAHPMPVEALLGDPVGDPETASASYAQLLVSLCGSPPVLDVVHLGLGADGHTASLVPGDPVLEVSDSDVGVTGTYEGRRRMTMTFPILDRARRIVWQVTGADKAAAVRAMVSGGDVPAARVRQDRALLLVDADAASGVTDSDS